jgi:PAS domain S-box-containing protein
MDENKHEEPVVNNNFPAQFSDAWYRLIADTTLDWETFVDPQGNYVYCSPACERITGYPPEAFLESPEFLLSLVYPEHRAAVAQHFTEDPLQRQASVLVYRLRAKNGEERWIEHLCRPLLDAQGVYRGQRASNRDVTQARQSEGDARKQERLWEEAQRITQLGSYEIDMVNNQVHWSQETYRIVGLDPNEPPPSPENFARYIHPEDAAEVYQNYERCLQTGEGFRLDYRIVRPSGEVRYIRSLASVVKNGAGRVTGMIGTFQDITERKQLEAVAARSAQVLALFVENAPAAIAMLDREMRYLAYSRRYLQDYNLHDQNLLGRSHYEVFPEISEPWKEIHRRCLAGAIERREEDPFPRQDGTLDWVRWEIRPWHEANGEIGGILLFTEVITARKLAEDQLRASLEEKDTLLREVHHRVKNNLAAILGLIDIQRSETENAEARGLLHDLANRIQSMATIHEKLYQAEGLTKINFHEYLLSFVTHLRTTFHTTTPVDCRVAAAGVELSLDAAVPCGLIVNELVTNAFKYAFPEGKPGVAGDQRCEVLISMRAAGDGYILVVADNGVGLPKDLDWRTARTLGLRLVKMLGEHQLGGRLAVDSSAGTQITLTFNPERWR